MLTWVNMFTSSLDPSLSLNNIKSKQNIVSSLKKYLAASQVPIKQGRPRADVKSFMITSVYWYGMYWKF